MKRVVGAMAMLASMLWCAHAGEAIPAATAKTPTAMKTIPNGAEVITLGAGCLWCTEAVLQQIPGVLSVTSGYMGGHVPNPTCEQVCAGDTVSLNHFEPGRRASGRGATAEISPAQRAGEGSRQVLRPEGTPRTTWFGRSLRRPCRDEFAWVGAPGDVVPG